MFRNCNCCCNNYQPENDNCNMYETSCNMQPDYYSDNGCPCACGFDNNSVFPDNWMYAHSYVPHQRMNHVYTPEIGLKMGTIFPELVSPYCPGQSADVMNYLKDTNSIGEGCNS